MDMLGLLEPPVLTLQFQTARFSGPLETKTSSTEEHHLSVQVANVINPPHPPPPHRNKNIIHRRTSSFCASNNERH